MLKKKVAIVEIYVILAYFAYMVGGPKPISGTRHPLVSKNDKGAIGFCFEDLKNVAQNLPGSFIDIKQVSNPPYHLDILDTPF